MADENPAEVKSLRKTSLYRTPAVKGLPVVVVALWTWNRMKYPVRFPEVKEIVVEAKSAGTTR
jgi:hypothetical protein